MCGRKVVRLHVWVGARCGTQTQGYAVGLKGVPRDHSPEGCNSKLGFRGGQVRYGGASILQSWQRPMHMSIIRTLTSPVGAKPV